jgi:hypothetical protein
VYDFISYNNTMYDLLGGPNRLFAFDIPLIGYIYVASCIVIYILCVIESMYMILDQINEYAYIYVTASLLFIITYLIYHYTQ